MGYQTNTNQRFGPEDGSSFGNAMATGGRTLSHFTITAANMYATSGAAAGKVSWATAGSVYYKIMAGLSAVPGTIELLGVPTTGNIFNIAYSGLEPTFTANNISWGGRTAGARELQVQAYANGAVSGAEVGNGVCWALAHVVLGYTEAEVTVATV